MPQLTYEDNNGETLGAEPVVKGEMLKLYIYDLGGMHGGARWFSAAGPVKYPGEEITGQEAFEEAATALRRGLEIRITNGLDWIVFHADRGEIIFPKQTTVQPASMQLEEFWKTL